MSTSTADPAVTSGAHRARTTERKRPRYNGQLRAGCVLLGAIVLVVLVAPLFLPDPNEQNLDRSLLNPSFAHFLGTDQLGRDVFVRVLVALRLDLLIGGGSMIAPLVIGTLLGALAGWRGGWLDYALSILADVVQAFPYYLLIIVLVFFLGAGVPSIFAAVALVAWVSYMRIVRAAVQRAVTQDHVRAALGGGLSQRRVLLRHVLPNVIGQPLVYLSTDIVVTIISTATLTYLGLGIAPPTAELGGLIADGQEFIGERPLLSLSAGLAVVIVGVALALIGNGSSERLEEGA